MRLFCILFCIVFVHNTYAQIDNIVLPKGDREIKIRQSTPIFSIHIDELKNIYLEDRLTSIQELDESLSNMYNKVPLHLKSNVVIFLYADARLDYMLIDQVKTQISRVDLRKVVYKTNSIEDEDFLKGVYRRTPPSYFRGTIEERLGVKTDTIFTGHWKESTNVKNNISELPPPEPPPRIWIYDFEEIIYSNQKEVIKEVLLERTNECVTITDDGFLISSGIITLDQVDQLTTLFRSNEVLLVNFDRNLKYKSYFNAINVFKTVLGEMKNRERKPFILELSLELTEYYQKEDITVCD